MLKLVKLVLGLLFLPLCVGAAVALWQVLLTFRHADTIWLPLAAGAGAWIVIYILLPRPMWFYVLGHELTHAIAAWCFGGRVGGMKVRGEGGHVALSKTNFVIALAPYFFPFYVVIVLLLFLLARLVWPWEPLQMPFLVCLGMAYGFHVTLTAHVLKTRQSDITQHGYLFSSVIICLGNLLLLLLGLPLLTSTPPLPDAFVWCWEATIQTVESIRGWVA